MYCGLLRYMGAVPQPVCHVLHPNSLIDACLDCVFMYTIVNGVLIYYSE